MNKRFFEYLRVKKVSQRSLSKLTGIAPSVISRFCSGNSISSDKLQRLVQACEDLSLEWLFYGNGEMIRTHGDTITYNTGKYAGSDVVQDGGVMVKGSKHVSVSPGGEISPDCKAKDDIIAERDRTISERDAVIAKKDAYILELLNTIKK